MIIPFLFLIFLRPFICSPILEQANFVYTLLLTAFLISWIIIKGLPFTLNRLTATALGVFLVSLLASVVISTNKIPALKEMDQYLNGIAIFLICHSLSNEDRSKLITCLTVAGIAISFLAIYQYFFLFPDWIHRAVETKMDPFDIEYLKQKRVCLPCYTPNSLGGYLIVVIPLVLTFRQPLLFFIPLFIALLLTKSIGAIMSLCLVSLIYIFDLHKELSKNTLRWLLRLLIIASLVLIARTATSNEYLHPSFSINMRQVYWQETFQIIKSHPWLGIGLGDFDLIYSRYSHNVLLQMWAEMGILALVSFLVLSASILWTGFTTLKKATDKTLTGALICASCAFLLHNLIEFTFFLPEVSLIWCAIMGFLSRDPNRPTQAKPSP